MEIKEILHKSPSKDRLQMEYTAYSRESAVEPVVMYSLLYM